MKQINKIIHGMKTANLPSDYWTATCLIKAMRSYVELPELQASKLIMQRNGQSVWEHTMSVVDLLTIKNDITLLSGLFHDLGKGYVSHISLTRLFPGHSKESVNIAEIRLAEWGATPYIIDRVIRIISTHMFDISHTIKEKTIRKFVADVGIDNIENWFVVRVADSRSYSSHQKHLSHFIKPFMKVVESYLERQPKRDQSILKQPGEVGTMQIEGRDN